MPMPTEEEINEALRVLVSCVRSLDGESCCWTAMTANGAPVYVALGMNDSAKVLKEAVRAISGEVISVTKYKEPVN